MIEKAALATTIQVW
uniref:Uncharacterized protein n=1 Tax=Arundo donax TaxID=35708 RepID=A0A0A9F596_ARUDO